MYSKDKADAKRTGSERHYVTARGRDSSVGIATCYEMDGPGIASQWGARFSATVQPGPGVHPTSCKMSTESFPLVKRPGRVVNYSPSTSVEVKK